jgi:hypothetical protein
MIEWNIQSRAHTCQACHRHFVDKEAFHTLLYDQKQSYERLDVCEECWKSQFSQGGSDRKGFISHWAGNYTAPVAAPPEAIGKENAESLLRKLIEQNDPSHAGARFILAVMLERKRILKVKAQVHDEAGRTLIYEHAKSGDLFSIRDPDLQLNQLEAVQRDVAHLLERGLDTGNAAAAPVTPPATDGSPELSAGTDAPESPADSERTPAGTESPADNPITPVVSP